MDAANRPLARTQGVNLDVVQQHHQRLFLRDRRREREHRLSELEPRLLAGYV